VVTTTEHQTEVAELLGSSENLMPVAAAPNLEAVIKLARLPVGSEVAVIAKTDDFIKTLERLLAKIGCNGIVLVPCIGEEREQVRQCVAKHDVVITAESLQNVVRQVAKQTQDIITFYYEIDQGSLQQVASRLVAKTEKTKE
jgi:prefoldin subunit 5